jgi:hypothetical protein
MDTSWLAAARKVIGFTSGEIKAAMRVIVVQRLRTTDGLER